MRLASSQSTGTLAIGCLSFTTNTTHFAQAVCDQCQYDGNDELDCKDYGLLDQTTLIAWSRGSQDCKDTYSIAISNPVDPTTTCASGNNFVNALRFGSLQSSGVKLGLGVGAMEGGFFELDNNGSIVIKSTITIDGTTFDCEASEADCYNAMQPYFSSDADGIAELEDVCETIYNQIRLDQQLEESTLRIRLCMEIQDAATAAPPESCDPLFSQILTEIEDDPDRSCQRYGFGVGSTVVPGCEASLAPTLAPVPEEPTIIATTSAPTSAPVTNIPSTVSIDPPTTSTPTTIVSALTSTPVLTDAPMTASTDAPTTSYPTSAPTFAPVTDIPTTVSTDAPTTSTPSSDAPTTVSIDAPTSTSAPATSSAPISVPVTDAPTTASGNAPATTNILTISSAPTSDPVAPTTVTTGAPTITSSPKNSFAPTSGLVAPERVPTGAPTITSSPTSSSAPTSAPATDTPTIASTDAPTTTNTPTTSSAPTSVPLADAPTAGPTTTTSPTSASASTTKGISTSTAFAIGAARILISFSAIFVVFGTI